MQRPQTEASTQRSDHPYNKFLVGQKQRQHEWNSVRDSKRTKEAQTPAPATMTSVSASPTLQDVTVLRQQLAAKTEECHQSVNRLDAVEAATTKILSCQMQMQDQFIKVMY